MKIQAAVVREKAGPFIIEQVDLDEPKAGEVLVRMVATGLCHTDLVARAQFLPVPLPAVFGHEGSGIVESVGPGVTKVKAGDHVVMSYLYCGTCPSCKKGIPSWCLNFLPSNFAGVRSDGSTTMKKGGQAIHGSFFGQSSFGAYALASERNVVKVQDDVPLEILGPLGCGIQTGAGGVINSLQARPGSSIAVFGVGSVGLVAVMAAYASGCTTIIAVDVVPARLKVALEMGATHTIDSNTVDPVEEIRKITGGGVEYSLECAGIPKVLRQAVDALTWGGVCGLIGVAPMGAEVSLDMQNILNGRAVKGIVEGDSNPDVFIPQLIELYKRGRLPFDRIMTFYPFEQINQAAEDSENGKTLKAVLRFS
jgi:aryl-alcohol dehydrogenase